MLGVFFILEEFLWNAGWLVVAAHHKPAFIDDSWPQQVYRTVLEDVKATLLAPSPELFSLHIFSLV